MRRLVAFLFLLSPAALAGCPSTPATMDAVQEDVFTLSCAFSTCHGDAQEAGLGLSDEAMSASELINVESVEIPGATRVVPGDSTSSLLFQVLDGEVDVVRQMPPGSAVTAAQKDLVRRWIDDGAPTD